MSGVAILAVAALAIVTAAAATGLASTLALLHENWTGWYGPNAHGYIVLAAALYLAASTWRTSPPPSLRPAWWAFLALGALVLLLTGLELTFVNNTRLLLLPLLVLAAVAAVFGRDAAKRLTWPAAFLYFALPQWWIINGPLQSMTTTAVAYALRWTRVPAFVEGNVVQLASGTFEIASGCSGLNYLQAATALAAFHGMLLLNSWRNRCLLLVAAAGTAIVFNWIRVYAVIAVGNATQMQHYLITVEHHTFGWVLFTAAMVPVFLWAARLERNEQGSADTGALNAAPARTFPAVSKLVAPAALAAGGLLLLPIAMTSAEQGDGNVSTALPASLDDVERGPFTSGWAPVFLNANEDRGSFNSDSTLVEIYRAVYPQQNGDRRLLRPSNDFLGADFREIGRQRRNVELDAGRSLQLTEYRGTLRQRPRVLWGWYWVAEAQVAGGLPAKLAELRGVLRGRRDGAAIALSTDCVPDCDVALARLMTFARRHERQLAWPPETKP